MATLNFSSHQVEILFDENPICAGTLISSYLVLTVFSCLKGRTETGLKVQTSGKDAAGNFQTKNVDTIHSFPALKSEPSGIDIAVILLDGDFNLDDPLSLIGRDSNEPGGFIALSSSASSLSTCGSFPVGKTEKSACNLTTDNPNSICVKPSPQSSCPVPLIGSGLICQVYGLNFLCGALAGNGTNTREYINISKYLHWIQLTFDTYLNGNGDSGHGLVPSLFGGREVSASGVSSSIPYQLSLQDRRSGNWQHICGAMIIDEKTVLTAAHCFEGKFTPSDFQVVAGVTHLNSTSSTKQILPLQEIIRHHRYKIQKWFLGNDIAILHVNGSFVYNENVRNIWISPPQEINPADFPGRVSGWGQISGIKKVSNSLQEADMRILPDDECNKIWSFLTPSMICPYNNKSNTCGGDSGGPLVIQNYQFNQKTRRDLLVGISSFSHDDCEKRDMPNGFTEVSHFLKWIKKNRASKCEANEFHCLNGGCIDECSLCNGADECGDGSTEKQCEQEMDVTKLKDCARKNQQELKNVAHSLAPNIQELEEEVGKLERMLQVENDEGGQTRRRKDQLKVVTEFERKIWNVAANLYKGANKPELENFIFSPLSLTTAMAMLNSGAGGETAREIQNLFKFGNNLAFTVRNQTAVLNSLKNQPDAQFVTASKIYANIKNSNLRWNYVRAVSSLGDVATLDFTDPKPVVAWINWWFKNQTYEKIRNIVDDKDFSKETAVVLLNALYFKAPWKQPFNKRETKKADFHVSEDETVQVEMMYISAEFPYAELEQVEATAVFLPYKGDRFSMIIYLPWVGRKLSTVEEKLETLVPAEVRYEAETTEISLHLPKFNINSSLDFKEILESLGVQKMFKREEADFGKLSESEGYHVSKVRQKVVMEVTEDEKEGGKEEEDFILPAVSAQNTIKVNRPFIFQIYDSVTSAILLTGRVTNPNPNGNRASTRAPPTTTIRTPSRSSLGVRNMAPNSNDDTDPNCCSVEKTRTNNNPTLTVTSSASNQTASNCLSAHGANQPEPGKNVSQLTQQLQCITETIKKLQVFSCRKSNVAILYPRRYLQSGDKVTIKIEQGIRCMNLPPNWIHSVYVKEGRCVQLYEQTNCIGRHLEITQSVNGFTNGRVPKSIKNC